MVDRLLANVDRQVCGQSQNGVDFYQVDRCPTQEEGYLDCCIDDPNGSIGLFIISDALKKSMDSEI